MAVSPGSTDLGQSFSLVTSAPRASLAARFAACGNSVAYRGDNASLAVTAAAGAIPGPATVEYTVFLQTPVSAAFAPPYELSGTLFWDGANLTIPVPVDWSQVRLSVRWYFCLSVCLSVSVRPSPSTVPMCDWTPLSLCGTSRDSMDRFELVQVYGVCLSGLQL
jgi:hypothetical protein